MKAARGLTVCRTARTIRDPSRGGAGGPGVTPVKEQKKLNDPQPRATRADTQRPPRFGCGATGRWWRRAGARAQTANQCLRATGRARLINQPRHCLIAHAQMDFTKKRRTNPLQSPAPHKPQHAVQVQFLFVWLGTMCPFMINHDHEPFMINQDHEPFMINHDHDQS